MCFFLQILHTLCNYISDFSNGNHNNYDFNNQKVYIKQFQNHLQHLRHE